MPVATRNSRSVVAQPSAFPVGAEEHADCTRSSRAGSRVKEPREQRIVAKEDRKLLQDISNFAGENDGTPGNDTSANEAEDNMRGKNAVDNQTRNSVEDEEEAFFIKTEDSEDSSVPWKTNPESEDLQMVVGMELEVEGDQQELAPGADLEALQREYARRERAVEELSLEDEETYQEKSMKMLKKQWKEAQAKATHEGKSMEMGEDEWIDIQYQKQQDKESKEKKAAEAKLAKLQAKAIATVEARMRLEDEKKRKEEERLQKLQGKQQQAAELMAEKEASRAQKAREKAEKEQLAQEKKQQREMEKEERAQEKAEQERVNQAMKQARERGRMAERAEKERKDWEAKAQREQAKAIRAQQAEEKRKLMQREKAEGRSAADDMEMCDQDELTRLVMESMKL
ncbi:hypothetical protein CYMTET_6169 [Cymbomonas tetramitiformis]|uniref:Uncharacterized protein n=1 Tax=Cymbomonas tetramitiformis TaxID=36881 RepID=A0AAE0GXQ2_9CHLO|nr:hypothetical protein CYMTET_6169 [Cymbomonas tetramitiformis]